MSANHALGREQIDLVGAVAELHRGLFSMLTGNRRWDDRLLAESC